jgi:hypothetical protein
MDASLSSIIQNPTYAHGIEMPLLPNKPDLFGGGGAILLVEVSEFTDI